jgi:branched-chain amino acid transport system permease protein
MDPTAAGQVGVNVDRTSMATWALAGAIAALCGILISSQVALTVGFMDPLLLDGLAAALIGGLTNPVGAFGTGIGLGILEGLLNYYAKTPGLVEVSLAGLIVVVLLARPSGLVRAAY